MASGSPLAPELAGALGEHAPHFAALESGRIRCELTGHEVVPSPEQLKASVSSKQFSAALAAHALHQEPQKV